MFVNHKPDGPYEVPALIALPGFREATLVCCDGDLNWHPAREEAPIRLALGLQMPGAPVAVSSGDFISPDHQFMNTPKPEPQSIRASNRPEMTSAPSAARAAVDWVAPQERPISFIRRLANAFSRAVSRV